jgi:hypothetical protein
MDDRSSLRMRALASRPWASLIDLTSSGSGAIEWVQGNRESQFLISA